MNRTIILSISSPADFEEIIILLKECQLPYADITTETIKNFVVAKEGVKIAGCIGLEKYEQHGLLRSMAVKAYYRSAGIASQLYNFLLSASPGVTDFHLLTTTAQTFFSKRNFIEKDRNLAPLSIKSTAEFSSLCPSTSTYMHLKKATVVIL